MVISLYSVNSLHISQYMWSYTDLTTQLKSNYRMQTYCTVDIEWWLYLPISPDPMMELMKLKEADVLELVPPSVCSTYGESNNRSSSC